MRELIYPSGRIVSRELRYLSRIIVSEDQVGEKVDISVREDSLWRVDKSVREDIFQIV